MEDDAAAAPFERKSARPFDELLAAVSDAHRHQVQGLELELARVQRLLSHAQRPHAGDGGAGCGTANLREGAVLSVPGAVGLEGDGQVRRGSGQFEEFSEVVPLSPASMLPASPEEGAEDGARQASKTKDWVEAIECAKVRKSTSLWSGVTASASHESRRRRWSYKLVKNVYFDTLSYTLITANAIFIGLSVQRQLHCTMHGVEIESAYDTVEICFLCWFSSELILKIFAEDIHVFVGPDRIWNFLDLFLVLTAMLQVGVDRSTEATAAFPNLTLTRNVRLFRVTRILRIIQVVRVCQSLRVMIFAILRSLDALLWVFAVLFFFKYMFAMAFMYATATEFEDHRGDCPLSDCLASTATPECTTTCERLTWLEVNMGSLRKVMITLFQSITGGRDWGEVYDVLTEMNWTLGAAFITFIYFMVFLVLNVVIGTVVDVTSGVSRRDHDSVVAEEMNKLKEYTRDIKLFFEKADTDKSGQLSYDEFTKYLQEDQVKAYFRALDLDSRQAHVLFTLLDCNESGEVGYNEFLEGCLRLKGEARSLDMNLVIYQLQHLLQHSQAPAGVQAAQPGQVSPASPRPERLGVAEALHLRSSQSSQSSQH